MDQRPATAANRQRFTNFCEFRQHNNELVSQRLNVLLELNAETAHKNSVSKSEQEKLEASLMRHPLDTHKTFSYLGLMLGLFPPAAIFAKFLFDSPNFRTENLWIIGVLFIINLITAIVGYFSGKLIGKMVKETETYSWWLMLFVLPFIGILWGVMTGGAGGAIVFLFGAFFGAVIGAMVGSAALSVFVIFHRLLKKDDAIEFKHFMPLSFGITFTICAFILGL